MDVEGMTTEEKMKLMVEHLKRLRATVASMDKFLVHMEVRCSDPQAVDMEGFEVIRPEDMEAVVSFFATFFRVCEEDQAIEPVQ